MVARKFRKIDMKRPALDQCGQRLLRIGQRRARQAAPIGRAYAACAPAPAGRGTFRRRSCAGLTYRAAQSGRRPPPPSACSAQAGRGRPRRDESAPPRAAPRAHRVRRRRDRAAPASNGRPVSARWQARAACVDAVRRRMQGGIEHDIAAPDRIFRNAVAGEIERTTLAGMSAFRRPVLRVDGAHASRNAGRTDRHRFADRNCARQYRAGDDRSHACQRKASIHGEPEAAVRSRAHRNCARRRTALRASPQYLRRSRSRPE